MPLCIKFVCVKILCLCVLHKDKLLVAYGKKLHKDVCGLAKKKKERKKSRSREREREIKLVTLAWPT